MVINNGLLQARVMHKREHPKENSFTYRVFYLAFPLHALKECKNRLLSIDRFNLYSIFQRDRGDGRKDNQAWIASVLKSWELDDVADGDITLITMPRMIGYAFNPVSFWCCHDKNGDLRCVLSEVNNTFGERHIYLSAHDDKRPIAREDWMHSKKVFHVSPFLKVEGRYDFRFIIEDRRIAIWINHVDPQGHVLYTTLSGKRIPLTARNLLHQTVRAPFVTFKVTSLIYWQALKLAKKKIKYNRKPSPPDTVITR